ncbi:hypothetical protein [Eubacterium limosum]|uniref:hypothetical protein n=1 Tax=Eubacterium limosum TaxID=1736 RepID=UPI00106434AE|nr:hypothetical protein [Eubacterium limosum]
MSDTTMIWQMLHLEKSGEHLNPPLLVARGCGYSILFGYDSLAALLKIEDPGEFAERLKNRYGREHLWILLPGKKPGELKFEPFLDTCAMLDLLILAEQSSVITQEQHTDWQCFLDGFIEGDIGRAEREGKVSRDGVEFWVRMPR